MKLTTISGYGHEIGVGVHVCSLYQIPSSVLTGRDAYEYARGRGFWSSERVLDALTDPRPPRLTHTFAEEEKWLLFPDLRTAPGEAVRLWVLRWVEGRIRKTEHWSSGPDNWARWTMDPTYRYFSSQKIR